MAPKFRPGQPRFVVPQVGGKIDEALNADADPTLKFLPLTPQYAVASLNYIIDRHARVGSTLSLSMFWSIKSFPIFVSLNVLILAIRLSSQMKYNHWYNLMDATNFMQFMVFLTATLAASLLFYKRSCWFINDDLERLTETGGAEYFDGVNLKQFTIMENEEEYLRLKKAGKLPTIKDTQIVLYRDTPVGIVTVSKEKTASSENTDQFTISAMGVRHVYVKTGLYIDLIAWAINHVKKSIKKNRNTFLEIEIYDCEEAIKQALIDNGFKCIETRPINHRVVGQYFHNTQSVYRYTF